MSIYSRLCCIRNCLGPETPRNIYKFPIDKNERNLWLNATKGYLRNNCCSVDNLFICMRHFSDECLHSASYKIWKDGCEVDVQRKYRKLKKNSVPSIFEVIDEDSETEKSKTKDNEEKDENFSEDFKSISMKYTFANSSEINSDNNDKKKLAFTEIEADGLQLTDFYIKKPPIRRRAKRKTHSNEINLENLKKSKPDENSSQRKIPISKFPQFTFADSFKDENTIIKRRKVNQNVAHSRPSNCEKTEQIKNNNKLYSLVKNENPSLNSQNFINDKSNLETNNLQSTNSSTTFPNFTFANSDTNNYKNNREISLPQNDGLVKSSINNIVKIKTESNQLPATINTGEALIINPVKPSINNIVKIKTEANHLPATINTEGTLIINPVKPAINNIVKIKTEPKELPATLNAGGTLIINRNDGIVISPTIAKIANQNSNTSQLSTTVTPPTGIMRVDQNGTAQTTINNIVKLNPNTNQLQSTIPISDLSNYTFATRPKPSSPNCTEVLILKKLNPIEKSQLNKVATFATFPNLNFANNGIINNNSTVNLPGSDILKISEVHSESPSILQPEVHFADKTNKKNENSNTMPETESPSQRTKKRKNERDLSPSSLRRINIVNELMALNSSHPVNESPVISNCTSIPMQSTLSSTNSTVQYSKSTLMWSWNCRNVNEFPKYWGMIDSPEGLFFGYVGDVPNAITRSIFVKEDMTVELRANNHIAKSPLIEKIINIQQLRIAMITIVSMNLCSNSLDGHCENGFYLRKNGTASKKCKECQLKIYKEHSAQRRKNRRLIAKKERRAKNLRNIRQKLTRAVNRMEIMQKAYVELSSTLLPIK